MMGPPFEMLLEKSTDQEERFLKQTINPLSDFSFSIIDNDEILHYHMALDSSLDTHRGQVVGLWTVQVIYVV